MAKTKKKQNVSQIVRARRKKVLERKVKKIKSMDIHSINKEKWMKAGREGEVKNLWEDLDNMRTYIKQMMKDAIETIKIARALDLQEKTKGAIKGLNGRLNTINYKIKVISMDPSEISKTKPEYKGEVQPEHLSEYFELMNNHKTWMADWMDLMSTDIHSLQMDIEKVIETQTKTTTEKQDD